MFPIKIERGLTLRPFEERDAELLFSLVDKNRAYLRNWLPWLDHNTHIEDTKKFIEEAKQKWASCSALTLGIFQEGGLCGVVSFNEILKQEEASIGYWLAQDYQGRGLIAKALKVMIDFGFNVLNLEKVTISCASNNSRSKNVAERLGFVFEQHRAEYEDLYGEKIDHNLYVVTAEDWGKSEYKCRS